MSILSDEAILSAIDLGELEIDPFNSDNLTPNGYDLTISEVEIPNYSKIDKGEMIVPPGTRFAVSTKERIACGANLVAQLWLRTSWARKGIACSFGKMFLFSLAAGGQHGVEHLLQNMHDEIKRNMVLMGCKSLNDLDSSKLIYRK